MTRPVSTNDAAKALRSLIDVHARETADGNDFVSRRESPRLHPFLRRIELQLRDEGGPGTWVRVGPLVDRAMQQALAAWDRVNPPSNPLDQKWLARAEIDALRKEDEQLGELTQLAYDRARANQEQPAPVEPAPVEPAPIEPPPVEPAPAEPVDAVAAARAWVEATDFVSKGLHDAKLPGAVRIDARSGAARAKLPEAVRRVFDAHDRVELGGRGTVSLRRGRLGVDVWVIATAAATKHGFIEVLDAGGKPLVGARLFDGAVLAWDSSPGRLRLCRTFATAGGFAKEEGMSEPESRAEKGQPQNEWPGEATIDTGTLYGSGRLLDRLETPVALTDPLRELAIAAFDHLWEVHLRHTLPKGGMVILGRRRQGVLVVGDFSRSTDGKTYQTAAWQDIDDGSFVLYYRRGSFGLELVSEQFDN